MLETDCELRPLHHIRRDVPSLLHVTSAVTLLSCADESLCVAAPAAHTARHLLLDDETRRGEKLKDIADCITRPRRPTSLQLQHQQRPASAFEPTRDRDCVLVEEETATQGDKPVSAAPRINSKTAESLLSGYI